MTPPYYRTNHPARGSCHAQVQAQAQEGQTATLDEKIDELQTDLLRALEKQTKTIEARFAAMPARK